MQNNSKAGFSLLELSVVLIIMGLIAVAIISGRSIIQASETRAVMSEIRKHMQSFNQFTERYKAYPGDFRSASVVFQPLIQAIIDGHYPFSQGLALTDYNGNGDNQIKWGDAEGVKAWSQLQLAGLTDGVGTSDPRGTAAIPRANIPGSNIGGGGNGYFIDYSATMQNYLGLGGVIANGRNTRSALSPERAANIDGKMDDGKPSSGFMQSTNGTESPPMNCINTAGGYNTGTSSDAVSCLLMIRLN